MFFSNPQLAINPVYLVVRRLCYWNSGRVFWRGGSFIAGPALRLMGVDWNSRSETEPGAHCWQVDRRSKKTSHAGQCRSEARNDHGWASIAGAGSGAQLIQALKRAGT